MTDIVQQLKNNQKRIAIWGLGYIGYSSMANFARAGIQVIGMDVSQKRIDDINSPGREVISGMNFWLGFDVKPFVERGLIYATTNWNELIAPDIAVHFISVPTEKDGKPYSKILEQVITQILRAYSKEKSYDPPLIVIESTLVPNMLDKIILPLAKDMKITIGKEVLLGVAPRRDWFVSPDKTVKTLPRIVGGVDKKTTELITKVLGIICDQIIPATDYNHACIVKSIENAYRHLDIAFANQLSLAYPHLNITEILKLVGTKWNVETYHPSFGTGGYCIPLAPHYVLEGALYPKKLTLLHESLKTDLDQPVIIAQAIKDRNAKSVGILGLAYTGDLKVHTLSPTISLVKELKSNGIVVKVNDPLYSEQEIKEICDAETFDFPGGLSEFDVILIVSTHTLYRSTSHSDIVKNLGKSTYVLDNMGIWADVPIHDSGLVYHQVGDAGWI